MTHIRTFWGATIIDHKGGVHRPYLAKVHTDGSIQCWDTKDLTESYGWLRGAFKIATFNGEYITP